LLKEIEENEKGDGTDTELEITWGADGREASKTKISKKSGSGSEKEETPFELLRRNKREKSRTKRERRLDEADEVNSLSSVMIYSRPCKQLLNYVFFYLIE